MKNPEPDRPFLLFFSVICELCIEVSTWKMDKASTLLLILLAKILNNSVRIKLHLLDWYENKSL